MTSYHKGIKASNGKIIDENILELVECLWQIGFTTRDSCEGVKVTGPGLHGLTYPRGEGYITFPTTSEVSLKDYLTHSNISFESAAYEIRPPEPSILHDLLAHMERETVHVAFVKNVLTDKEILVMAFYPEDVEWLTKKVKESLQ